MAGRLADRGELAAVVSFGATALAPWLLANMQLGLIGLSVVGLDLGVQATPIARQTIVYGLEPVSCSRLNAVLLIGVSVGLATGASRKPKVRSSPARSN